MVDTVTEGGAPNSPFHRQRPSSVRRRGRGGAKGRRKGAEGGLVGRGGARRGLVLTSSDAADSRFVPFRPDPRRALSLSSAPPLPPSPGTGPPGAQPGPAQPHQRPFPPLPSPPLPSPAPQHKRSEEVRQGNGEMTLGPFLAPRPVFHSLQMTRNLSCL